MTQHLALWRVSWFWYRGDESFRIAKTAVRNPTGPAWFWHFGMLDFGWILVLWKKATL